MAGFEVITEDANRALLEAAALALHEPEVRGQLPGLHRRNRSPAGGAEATGVKTEYLRMMKQEWKRPARWKWQDAWFKFNWRFRRAIRWALRDLPMVLLLICLPIACLLVAAIKYKVRLEHLHHVTGIVAEITTAFAGIAAMRFFTREYFKAWRTNNEWFDYGEKDQERTRWRRDPDLQVHFVTEPQRGFVIAYDGAPIGWSDEVPHDDRRTKSEPAISLHTAWTRAIELYHAKKLGRS